MDLRHRHHHQPQRYHHWIKLTIRWINCLNLINETINDIEDINVETLRCLIEKSPTPVSDENNSIDFLKNFIKTHYALFEFSDDPAEDEIVEFTSLLIHYFCLRVKDSRVMEAMCKNLNAEDQTDIMKFANFLINVKNITNQAIREAISDTVSENENFLSPDGLSFSPATFTSVSASSPIATPKSLEISRSRGRRKKINRLETELDAERFEKICLQEENERLNLKVQKLEKIRSENLNTIVQLRMEIKSNDNEEDDADEEKVRSLNYISRLEKDIKSLEEELLKAMGENNNLHEEAENSKKLITTMERDLSVLKSKVSELERNEMILKNELSSKETECLVLKSSAEELKKYWQEHRREHMLNASIESDDEFSPLRRHFTSPRQPETMQNILETQLQEDNRLLMEKVKELTDEIHKLENDNDKIKSELEISNRTASEQTIEIEKLFSENENIKSELFNHTRTIENHEKELTEKMKSNEQLSDRLAQLQNAKNSLEIKWNESEAHNKQKIFNLKKDIEELEKILDNQRNIHESEIFNKVNEINSLNQEINCKKIEAQEFQTMITKKQTLITQMTKEIDRLNKMNADYEKKIEKNDNFLVDSKKSNEKLKRDFNILEEQISSKDEKIIQLQNLICYLQLNKEELTNNIEELTKTNNNIINEKQTRIDNITAEVEQLLKDKVILKNEKTKLQTSLEELKKNLHDLSSENTLLHDEIMKKNLLIDEKDRQLNSDQNTIREMNTNNIHLTNSVTDLNGNITKLRDENEKLQQDFDVCCTDNESLQNKITILEDNLRDEIANKKEITAERDELMSTNAKLVSEISEKNSNWIVLNNIFEDNNVKYMEEIKSRNEEIAANNSQINKLNLEITGLTKSLEIERKQKDHFGEEAKSMQKENDSLKENVLQLEKEMLDKISKITNYEETLLEKQSLISKYEKVNEDMQLEINSKIDDLQHLQNEKDTIERENNSNSDKIQQLECEINSLQDNLKETSEVIESYKHQVNLLTTEKDEMQENISELKTRISEESLKYNQCTEKLTERELFIQEKVQEITESQHKLEELQIEQDRKENILKNIITEVSDLKDENITLKNSVAEMHQNLSSKEVVILSLNAQITLSDENLQKSKEQIVNLKQSIENYKRQVNLLTTEKGEMQENISELKTRISEESLKYNQCIEKLTERELFIQQKVQEIAEYQHKLNELQIEHDRKENILKNIITEVSDLKDENIALKNSVAEMNQNISSKENAILSLNAQITLSDENIQKSKEQIVNLKESMEEVEQVLKTKEQEIKILTEKFDTLNEVVDKILECGSTTDNTIHEDFTSLDYMDCNELKKSRADDDSIPKSLIDKLTEVRKSFESITKTCARNILEKDDEIEKIKTDLTAYDENNKILREEIESITNKLDFSVKENTHIVEKLNQEIHSLKLEVAHKEKEMNKLVEQNETLNEIHKEKDVLAAEVTLLSDINNTLEKNLECVKKELSDLKQNERNLGVSLYDKVQTITELNEKLNKLTDVMKNCKNDILSIAERSDLPLQELFAEINNDSMISHESFAHVLLTIVTRLVDEHVNLRNRYMISTSTACDDTKLSILNASSRDGLNLSAEISSTTLCPSKLEPSNEENVNAFISQIEESAIVLRNITNINKFNRSKIQELKNMSQKMQNKILSTSTQESTLIDALNNINEWEDKLRQMEKNDEENIEKLHNFIGEFLTQIGDNIHHLNSGEKINCDITRNVNSNSDLQILCNQSHELKERLNKTKAILNNIAAITIESPDHVENGETTGNAINNILQERCELKNTLNALTSECSYLKSVNQEIMKENQLLSDKYRELALRNVESDSRTLRSENSELRIKVETLTRKLAEARSSTDTNQLVTDMRLEYEDKLTRMKQKMKQLYQEEINKQTEKQKLENADTELLCKKYAEKINSYEQHVNQLSSQLWKVGEKLLTERREKECLKLQLKEASEHRLKERSSSQQSLNSIKSLPQTSTNRVEEWKKRSLPRGSKLPEYGNQKPPRPSLSLPKNGQFKVPLPTKVESGGLHVSDEEGEIFDNTYLPAMKMGICEPSTSHSSAHPPDRLSELQWRNSLCPPHLKSSYPVEMQFHQIREEKIKANDENESPVTEKTRPKKEMGQTTYKRPGPPTPSKHGGRLSLQGNDGREPLREQNDNVPNTKKATTPSRIKSFLGLTSKDENSSGTPKSKRMSIFRKQR